MATPPPSTDSTVSQPLHPFTGRVLNDRYRLLSFVGTGGMASLFRAKDRVLGRPVAVKLLLPKLAADPQFVARFQREAEYAAGLSGHPNIVSIFDVGQDGDLRYIVMEMIDGRNLEDIIRDEAPLPLDRAVDIACQIASALAFAHEHGLIHRDIKPQNVLVMRDGRVKVADFGIAWNVSATPMTSAGVVLGTAHYLSPEQAMGKPATIRSDIYSLGIVLYEMLTGKVPFDGEDRFAVAIKHAHDEPIPPDQINPAIPSGVTAVILQAMSKQPADRFESAARFAEALGSAAREGAKRATVAPVPIPAAAKPEVRPVVPVQQSVTPVKQPVPWPDETRRSKRDFGALIPFFIAMLALVGVAAVVAVTLERKFNPPATKAASNGTGKNAVTPPTHPAHAACTTSPSGLSLKSFGTSVQQIASGGSTTVTYSIDNASRTCRRIYLGAALVSDTTPGTVINDSGNSSVVRVVPGTHTYKRSFAIPSTAAGQTFDLQVTLSIFHGSRVAAGTHRQYISISQ